MTADQSAADDSVLVRAVDEEENSRGNRNTSAAPVFLQTDAPFKGAKSDVPTQLVFDGIKRGDWSGLSLPATA